jgi:2-haloalkanoic acid dehalogenase type II
VARLGERPGGTRRTELGRISCLTFDCYGTLIDWLGGLRAAAAQAESLAGLDLERLIEDRGRVELDLLAGPYRPYREIVTESVARAARLQGREVALEDARAIAASQASWPPFDESRAVLNRLAARFRLAILSNVETRVLERSVGLLDAPFAVLVTAEMLRSYKPAPAHFEVAPERLGVAPDAILHVAQSLVHDVRPALALGRRVAWVNRLGEPLPEGVEPQLVVPHLADLADRLGC